MQPNNQNGYWQPQEDQPVQPSSPPPTPQPAPQPVVAPQPIQAPPQPVAYQQPVQPIQPQPAPQEYAAPVTPEVPVQPVAAPQPLTDPAQQQYDTAEQIAATDEQQYLDEDDSQEYYDDEGVEDQVDDEEADAVNWQATEYIHQEKGAKWFVIFGIVLVAMLAVAIFLMKAVTFAILLVVVAATIIVFAKRPPRVLSYSLSNKGLHIGDTLHNFANFKSFGVIHDGAEYSVMLIPTKRFQPGVSVYFPEESGEAIVDMLGARLPMQDLKLDPVDKLTRFLRL